MNAATHVAPAGESSPIQAAQEAALRARRMNLASKGAQLLILSAYQALSGVLFLAVGQTASQRFMAWSIGLVVLCVAVPASIQRRRLRAGIKVIQKGELDFSTTLNPAVSRTYAIALILGNVAGLAAVWSAVLMSGKFSAMRFEHAVGMILGAMGLLLLWRYTRLGLWEDLLLTGCAMACGLAFGLWSTECFGWLLLILGLGGALAGWSLDRRWRAFVAALPKEDAA